MKLNLENIEPSNFIEEEIIKDLKSGRADHVQTRFPPEPTGYWHIGHAKAICINFEIAKKFGGKCFLRMDDTNPTKEDGDFAKSYLADLEWLGYKPDKFVYSSEIYFDEIYEIAEKIIEKGLAYVCDLSAEEVSKTRGTLTEPGKNSPYRERSVQENLQLFREMRAGGVPDGTRTLRAKIDMAHPNINMRDPVMYRILHVHHYKVGNKWCIYPSYDFAHPLEDALEGATFSLCDINFEDHRPLYNWFLQAAGLAGFNGPRQIEFGKMNLESTLLGKRHLKALVQSGYLLGWDDPRIITLVGMKRRGYPPMAVREFIARGGVAKTEGLTEVAALEACVRENLNAAATRAMVVLDPLKVILTNFEEVAGGKTNIECEIENLPAKEGVVSEKHTCVLTKEIFIEKEDFSLNPPPKYNRLTEGGMVRLKGAYIIKCNKVVTGANGEPSALECEIIPGTKSGEDGSGIKVKGTIHFVSAEANLKIKVREFTPLIKPEFKNLYKELNDGRNLQEMLNPCSLTEHEAFAETFLKEAETGNVFQFIRKGYYCKDKDSTEAMPVFNLTVTLKDGFK